MVDGNDCDDGGDGSVVVNGDSGCDTVEWGELGQKISESSPLQLLAKGHWYE